MNLAEMAAGVLLGVPAVVSIGYYLASPWLLRRWLREPRHEIDATTSLPPVSFFRPIKTGVPELRAILEQAAAAMLTEDQLLIGVEAHSPEESIAAEVARAFPAREIVVIRCQPGRALNPKISKLVQMIDLARHENWIVSDSEATLDAAFLENFRREWRQCDVLTAGYRFRGAETWPQRLDAAAILLTLWPGLAVLNSQGPLRLTLGACTGFRRTDLAAIGGFGKFGDLLAEDHALGVALAASRRQIGLSREIVTLRSDPLTWRDYWRHQRRVAITYRVANPLGFSGAWLTQGVPAAFLLALLFPSAPWLWMAFAAAWSARVFSAHAVAPILEFPLRAPWREVLAASFVETACWLLSWLANSIWWSGRRWRIGRDGYLRGSAADGA